MDKDNADKALFEFAAIANGLGIRWFLVLGTCLGMVRDGGYIAGDNDIDLGVICSIRDLAKLFKNASKREFRIGKAFLNPDDEKNLHIYKYGILIDVFYTFRREDTPFFRSLEEITYCGRKFRVPSPVGDYLSLEFGDWKTPRPGKSRGPGREIKPWWIKRVISQEM